MTEEEYCMEMLRLIREQYEKDAKPYLDRLASLHATRPKPRMLIDPSTLDPEILATLKAKA